MAIIGKGFVLKHVFENVAAMEANEEKCGKIEDHFNIPWHIEVARTNGYLEVALYCGKSLRTGKWRIDFEMLMKIGTKEVAIKCWFGKDGDDDYGSKIGSRNFFEWEEMKTNRLSEGKLAVEIHVSIEKMTGVYKENLRCFDESMKAFSDIIFVVGDEQFYVSKLFIATQSPAFNLMLKGIFKESRKKKITLKGIHAEDFQKYLEVFYGNPAIDETTIEGILIVAQMYLTETVKDKCEEFLVEKSNKTLKKKLEIAIEYDLKKLKNQCISKVETLSDMREVLPVVRSMDQSAAFDLLEKMVSKQ